MSNVKNSNLKYLLSQTEDNILDLKDSHVLKWDDFRGTWSSTSVSEDMRRVNTQRLLQEVKAQVEQAAINIMDNDEAYHAMQRRINDTLHRYREMGAINSFNMDSMEHTFNLTIVPNVSLETINMEVRLIP